MIRPPEPVFWTNFVPSAAAPSVSAQQPAVSRPTDPVPAATPPSRQSAGRASLDAIGMNFGSDKAKAGHGFLHFYERFLAEMRDSAVAVLELGMNGGEAVRMWEEFFPQARVLGIDSRPECAQFAHGRIELGLSEPGDVLRLVELGLRHGPFDLIVDDWTHMWEHQVGAFRALYPLVRPGGYYILEDINTSSGEYVAIFQGSARCSAAAYLQSVADMVVSQLPPDGDARDDAFLKSAALKTEFIAFHKGTALLRRRTV